MPNLFLLLGTFLVLVSCQCPLDGSAWTASNVTVVFGASVGDWIPAIFFLNDQGRESAWFMTVRQATPTRFELVEVGVHGYAKGGCNMVGQYTFLVSDDCQTLDIGLIHDDCPYRMSLLTAVPSLASTSIVEDGQCASWMGMTEQTSESPQLSGEALSIYPGPAGLVIVSIGDYAAIFQLWSHRADDPANLNIIQDLLSVPAGYACEERFYGQYFITRESGCSAIMCGKADSCATRAGLFHGVALNGYDGGKCSADVDVLEWSTVACSDGNVWTKTPYECVDQFAGDQCMFCRGVANGLDVKLCLDRNGGSCNDIFRSTPSQGWCNLEMECPASTLSLSVFALLFISLALIFM